MVRREHYPHVASFTVVAGLPIRSDRVAPFAPQARGINKLDFEISARVMILDRDTQRAREVGRVPAKEFFP